VRPDPFGHDNVRACVAQRDGPAVRVLEKERLQGSGNEVRARKGTRHDARRSVTTARRSTEDGTVQVGVSKPQGERQLSARGNPEHRGALGRQHNSKARTHPSAEFLDEELLVSSEPLRSEAR
jgi:hypothetical protein